MGGGRFAHQHKAAACQAARVWHGRPTAAAGAGERATIMGFAIWVLIIIAYWAPTLIAWTRHVPNLAQVVVVNLLWAGRSSGGWLPW
jgi:hypothetical protein